MGEEDNIDLSNPGSAEAELCAAVVKAFQCSPMTNSRVGQDVVFCVGFQLVAPSPRSR
ncbi:hypothetical protein J6590_009142 [Homalodisca vitripennis]|nr:hypothetical protein J6590_009142 [Homalodisca vitripennis]